MTPLILHTSDYTETNNCEKYCGYQDPTGGQVAVVVVASDDLSNDPSADTVSLSLCLSLSLSLFPHQNIFMRSHKELHGHKVNPIL